MRGQRSTGLMAIARDQVQRTGRKARLHRQFSQLDAGQAGIFRGLEHGGIAHRQCRRQRASEHLRRIVPGNDVCRHAMRYAHQADVVAVKVGNGLAVDLVGGTAVELEVARHHLDIIACHGDGLAGITRFQLCDLLGMRKDQLTQAHQQASPLGGRQAAPGAGERASCSRDSKVDIGLAAA